MSHDALNTAGSIHNHQIKTFLCRSFAEMEARDVRSRVAEAWEMQVPRIRTRAVARVAMLLSDAYQVVHECLTDPECGYSEDPAAAAAAKRTPEEIRTILGIV